MGDTFSHISHRLVAIVGVLLAVAITSGGAQDSPRLASPRLERLRLDVIDAGDASASVLDAFWKEVEQTGTPLVEPIDARRSRVTFLWRDAETRNVRLFWPVFPARPDDDALTRLARTDV